MNFFKKKFAGTILYALVLTAFTVYTALDTFVIARVYTAVQPAGNADASDSGSNDATESSTNETDTTDSAPVVSENTYSDDHINIAITTYQKYGTAIYVANVTVSSPEYLKTALAQNIFGQNITGKTSDIAQANGAILAINGDYYGAQRDGYVLKNGVLYRESAAQGQKDLVIWADGSFEIITVGETTAAHLLEEGAVQILSFGPALVESGGIAVSEKDEVGKAKASNPRTAIGVIDELHYVFVVSDGRTSESKGLTLYQLAKFMQGLGVATAYNLDGGGSSTMYFNGEIINNPTTNGKSIKERGVSDIVYIG